MASPPKSGESPQVSATIAAGLARLWTRFLPEIEYRIELLKIAADRLRACVLTEEERSSAHAAAHKLAGILGTFGLSRGTDLARRVEQILDVPRNPGNEDELCQKVAELAGLIEVHKAASNHFS